jgi:hypothetical protein
MTGGASRSVLFQIDRPGEPMDMSRARLLLEAAGVQVDPSYGPIPIDHRRGRYVVRGTASPEALERVRELEGVSVFQDAPIGRTRG